MCEVELMNRTNGQTWIKRFDDLREARVFVNKCRFSKRVMVLSVVCDTYPQYQYVCYGK
jgi:hypothetical protein